MTADPTVRCVIMHAVRGNAMTVHAGVSWAMGRCNEIRPTAARWVPGLRQPRPRQKRRPVMLQLKPILTECVRSREGGWEKQSKRSADRCRACPACLPFAFCCCAAAKTNKTAIASENCQLISASLLTLTNHMRAQRLTPKKRPLETKCPEAGRARKPLLLQLTNHAPTLPHTRVCLSTMTHAQINTSMHTSCVRAATPWPEHDGLTPPCRPPRQRGACVRACSGRLLPPRLTLRGRAKTNQLIK